MNLCHGSFHNSKNSILKNSTVDFCCTKACSLYFISITEPRINETVSCKRGRQKGPLWSPHCGPSNLDLCGSKILFLSRTKPESGSPYSPVSADGYSIEIYSKITLRVKLLGSLNALLVRPTIVTMRIYRGRGQYIYF